MRLFLLSPARCDGIRASQLVREGAAFGLARELRSPEGAALGDLFSFASALYFRGKLAYARRFADAPSHLPGVLIITPDRGLVTPETRLDRASLLEMARVPVDENHPGYAGPLARDLKALAQALPAAAQVVLLGSVASSKYTALLVPALGQRLRFPAEFVGRGDMSRGGLLLRASRSGEELAYAPVEGTSLRGQRPARLGRPAKVTLAFVTVRAAVQSRRGPRTGAR